MATKPTSQFAFGGVSSFHSPANFPQDRAVRCRNFIPKQNGALQLRNGHSLPTMSTVSASDIHTAAYVEFWNDTKHILFSQSTALKGMLLSNGTVSAVGTLSNGNRWGHFRSNNKIHISNGTDFKSWDGTTLRDNGIRAPNSTESGAVAATSSTATAGSFGTTTLTGYQLYMSYYNPTTGHVGNRASIGSRVTVAGAGYSIEVTSLPDLSSVDTELVKLLGRTPDGGEVPYAFTTASGDWITVGNTNTTATFILTSIDFNSELPTRNTVGSGFVAFTKVLGRIFAIKDDDPNVYYSEAEEDSVSGDFVGRPEESWPANNAERFITGEPMVGVHAYAFEGWFFTRNYLGIWSEYLRQQLVEPWRGIWKGGLGGQRLFATTKYGPFWISGSKELLTWGQQGPVPISTEYQRSLLNGITDSALSTCELVWQEDPQLELDRLLLRGNDGTKLVVHDFKINGQGYDATFASATITTFVGCGYTPPIDLRDSNGRIRQWAGNSVGRFMQLDDGIDDNGATFTGDYIGGPIDLGFDDVRIVEAEIIGDENVQVYSSFSLDEVVGDWAEALRESLNEGDSRSAYKISNQGHFTRLRFTLVSQLGEDYDLTDPPHAPLNDYGAIYRVTFKQGAGLPQGR